MICISICSPFQGIQLHRHHYLVLRVQNLPVEAPRLENQETAFKMRFKWNLAARTRAHKIVLSFLLSDVCSGTVLLNFGLQFRHVKLTCNGLALRLHEQERQ